VKRIFENKKTKKKKQCRVGTWFCALVVDWMDTECSKKGVELKPTKLLEKSDGR